MLIAWTLRDLHTHPHLELKFDFKRLRRLTTCHTYSIRTYPVTLSLPLPPHLSPSPLPPTPRAAGVMLYHLLSGSFPFWSGGPEEFHGMSAAELRDGIVRGTPVFLKNPWTSYSPKVKDLICKMLEKDPRQRITARAACAHPWFGEVLGGEAAAGVEGAGAAAQLST